MIDLDDNKVKGTSIQDWEGMKKDDDCDIRLLGYIASQDWEGAKNDDDYEIRELGRLAEKHINKGGIK